MDQSIEPNQNPKERPESGKILPFKPIRQETVLSKLPIHNLSKKRSISIHIERRTKEGKLDLLWHVSPNRDFGEPGQLAYKLDTLIINRLIDELPRPLPRIIKIGSLRSLAKQLGLSPWKTDTNTIKNALHQNAGAYIRAKIYYTARNGEQKYLEPSDSRYGLIFTGERLPNGETADSVYIVLHDFFREIWNDAPRRPLNHDYLGQLLKLSTSSARFYEVVSYQIFAALKYNHATAKLLYSKYSTYSAQRRNLKLWQVKRQMTPIHRHHLKSGYLAEVWYEKAPADSQGLPDWVMHYVPGEKARAEYFTFTGKKLSQPPLPAPQDEPQPVQEPPPPPPPQSEPAAEQGTAPNPLITTLGKWGFAPQDAEQLLARLPEDQPVAEQLEYLESEIERQGTGERGIRNPAGFIRDRLLKDARVPDHFQSSDKRQAQRQEIEARKAAQDQLHRDYNEYCRRQAFDHAQQNQADYQALFNAKLATFRRQLHNRPDEEINKIARESTLDKIAENLPHLKSFEQWRADQQQPEAIATG